MDLVEEIERFVQARMEGAEPGHDLSHVNRVRRQAEERHAFMESFLAQFRREWS